MIPRSTVHCKAFYQDNYYEMHASLCVKEAFNPDRAFPILSKCLLKAYAPAKYATTALHGTAQSQGVGAAKRKTIPWLWMG